MQQKSKRNKSSRQSVDSFGFRFIPRFVIQLESFSILYFKKVNITIQIRSEKAGAHLFEQEPAHSNRFHFVQRSRRTQMALLGQ